MIASSARTLLKPSAMRSMAYVNYRAVYLGPGMIKRSFGFFSRKPKEITDEELLNNTTLLEETSVKNQMVHEPYQRQVGIWLLLVAGTIFGMIVLGGYTRLTKAGLSMTRWKPVQRVWPQTVEAWEEEFNHYKVGEVKKAISRVSSR